MGFYDDFYNLFSDDWYHSNKRYSIDEDGDNVYIYVELPGIDKEHVDIQFDRKVLFVTARYSEISNKLRSKNLELNLKIYRDVDTEAIKGELRDGVLKITIPKTEQDKPKRIPILE